MYVAAFAPDTGQDTAQQGQGYPAPPGLSHLRSTEGLLWLDETGARDDFAQDLGSKAVRQLFQAQKPIRATAFDDRVTHAAWRTRPSWYVVSREDRMIAPQLQTATAQRIGAQLRSVGASHASPLSHPTDVAYAILEAAGVKPPEPAPHEGG